MKVMQVTERVPVEPNHVYVISPAQNLSMNDGFLTVSRPEPRRGGHTAIDLFFTTWRMCTKNARFAWCYSAFNL